MEWYLMVWRKYAQFEGRSRRKEYWMFSLFNLIAIFALAALALVVGVMLANTGKVDSENSVPFLYPGRDLRIGCHHSKSFRSHPALS